MFGLGMPEILLILAIALIVIGPQKLPDLAKTLGRAMAEFKKATQDFKRSLDVESAIKDIKDVQAPKSDLKEIIKQQNSDQVTTPKGNPEEPNGSTSSGGTSGESNMAQSGTAETITSNKS